LYRAFLNNQSFFDLVRATNIPSLILRANRLSLPPNLPGWHKEMLQAYFLGVQHQTEALARSGNFTLSVRESSHMMMLEEPAALADELSQFLTAC
jgi:pimeloyl-ACP methyl ester carboxylesterase